MDYEKAYKAAKRLAAHWIEDGCEATERILLTTIFPELKESEDERIRSCICLALTDVDEQRFTDFGVTLKDCLAYLEKQKEPFPYIDFVIKPHKGDDDNPYDMSVYEAQDYAIDRGFGVPYNDGEVYVDERHMTQTIGNILRWADEHPKEQKPISTEETELNSIAFLEQIGYTCIPPGKGHSAEWSEEDERILNEIIETIEATRVEASRDLPNCSVLTESYWTMLRWLKSLRPQSHWKPNEEQMKALNALLCTGDFSYVGQATKLQELYIELKKL